MAGIEKVCEGTLDGHWSYTHRGCGPLEGDEFYLQTKNGKHIYRDTIQLCPVHMKELRNRLKNSNVRHKIVMKPLYYVDDGYSYKVEDTRDFILKLYNADGSEIMCPYTQEFFTRWFFDLRRFKRNMRKLLGVSRLNMKSSKALLQPLPYRTVHVWSNKGLWTLKSADPWTVTMTDDSFDFQPELDLEDLDTLKGELKNEMSAV
jgi:hypothetical protein